MDLASAALEAHKASEAERRAQYELNTAQNKLKQHRAIQDLAETFGVGPVLIDELLCAESGEPSPMTYWRWAYPVTEQVNLVIRTTHSINDLKVTAQITDRHPNGDLSIRSPHVRTLADIGAYLAWLPKEGNQ